MSEQRPPVTDELEGPPHIKNYMMNFGPQHPAAHGVMRLVLEMDGEVERGGQGRAGMRGDHRRASWTYNRLFHKGFLDKGCFMQWYPKDRSPRKREPLSAGAGLGRRRGLLPTPRWRRCAARQPPRQVTREHSHQHE